MPRTREAQHSPSLLVVAQLVELRRGRGSTMYCGIFHLSSVIYQRFLSVGGRVLLKKQF
jgi:hypothetical protein